MDKIVVLAAGLGRRMQRGDQRARLSPEQAAMAQSGVKALIPIDRPFLDYVLTAVADAGYRHVCLVIGPDHQQIRDYYAPRSGGRLEIEFAVQAEPLGTADALASAAPFAGEGAFAVINSDNYYPASALAALRERDGVGLVGFTRESLLAHGNAGPERIASYAAVEADANGYLTRIVEKPAADEASSLGRATLISMNCWRVAPFIFAACRSIDRSPRGEYEIPQAVTYSMRNLGQRFWVIRSEQAVLDLSCRGDIEVVARRLRDKEVRL